MRPQFQVSQLRQSFFELVYDLCGWRLIQLFLNDVLQHLQIPAVFNLTALHRIQHQFSDRLEEVHFVLTLKLLGLLFLGPEYGEEIVVIEFLVFRPAVRPEPVSFQDDGVHLWKDKQQFHVQVSRLHHLSSQSRLPCTLEWLSYPVGPFEDNLVVVAQQCLGECFTNLTHHYQ